MTNSTETLDLAEMLGEVPVAVTNEQVVRVLHDWLQRGDWHWYRDVRRFNCPAVDSELSYCSAAQAALLLGGYTDVQVLSAYDGTTARTIRLNRRRVVKGLQVFARRYPNRLLDVLRQEADMTTVRRFSQCLIYGNAFVK